DETTLIVLVAKISETRLVPRLRQPEIFTQLRREA
ncbi:MAG: hypothetical protein RLZZ30_1508, partial [Bacteroidota bacterium]